MALVRRPDILAAVWACTLALGATAAVAQQVLPAPLREGPKSDVPIALQIARWHMLDGDINTLTFRSMDALFTTRTVPHAGQPWILPRADHPLDFSYDYKGARYTPEQFLDRTYTNALLVMKDGRIVSEIYRNNTNDQTRFMAWSMTKSITSILIGCALAEGRIRSLDDAITTYLPELKDGGYDGVTIRQIMAMRSGVDYEERYDFEHPGTAASTISPRW